MIVMHHHLTIAELAERFAMSEEEVFEQCTSLAVPVLHGRVDFTLFEKAIQERGRIAQPVAA